MPYREAFEAPFEPYAHFLQLIPVRHPKNRAGERK